MDVFVSCEYPSLQKISYKNNNNAWDLEDGVERRKIKRTVTSWIPLVDK